MFFRSIRRLLLPAAAACALAACGPQVLPPSGTHPAIQSDRVMLYPKEPSRYELLGEIVMPVTPDMRFDEHGDSTAGFDALKARASVMGANGVLLVDKTNNYDYLALVGYRGMFYQVPMRKEPKAAVAKAIYVIQE
jgi:hypothetical protein